MKITIINSAAFVLHFLLVLSLFRFNHIQKQYLFRFNILLGKKILNFVPNRAPDVSEISFSVFFDEQCARANNVFILVFSASSGWKTVNLILFIQKKCGYKRSMSTCAIGVYPLNGFHLLSGSTPSIPRARLTIHI